MGSMIVVDLTKKIKRNTQVIIVNEIVGGRRTYAFGIAGGGIVHINSTINLHVLRWLEFTEVYWTHAIDYALKQLYLNENMTMKPPKRNICML